MFSLELLDAVNRLETESILTKEVKPLVERFVELLAGHSSLRVVSVGVGVDLEVESSRVGEDDLLEACKESLFGYSLDRFDPQQVTIEEVFFFDNFTPVEGGLAPQACPLLLQLVDDGCFDSLDLFLSWVPVGGKPSQKLVDPVLQEVGIFDT